MVTGCVRTCLLGQWKDQSRGLVLLLLLLLLLQAFVAGLPVRALRGVGFKSESVLRGWGVVTAGDAAALSKQMLVQGLGEKQGECCSFCFCAAVI
jgi:nucleotidyltransferase/DNA polymerase involved in DNA repair